MNTWLKAIGAVAGLFGASGVALAAVGAHRSGDPTVTTAAYFLLFHAAALIGLCAAAAQWPMKALLAAMTLLATGAILFSGELSIHALAGVALPALAPVGGMAMIFGWLAVAATLPTCLGLRERP